MMYGCIGEKLSHSFSKEIHERLVPTHSYELTELAPLDLASFFEKRGFCAINVTIPYKESVIPFLDELDELSTRIGAVNTVVKRSGRLYGYNTDFYGLVALLRHADVSVRGKKVAILGTGGTSKTARAVCESLGAREILLVSRTAGNGKIDYDTLYREHTDIEILINTTPVGMYPAQDEAAVMLDAFAQLSGVIDAIYNPLRTRLVLSARERGIPSEGGLYMLVAQAVRASELFHGCTYPEGTVDEVYQSLLGEKESIVLIGMPSSGKTTLGQMLAKQLARPFIDTDALFLERIKITPGDYINTHGEDAFRKLESEIVREISHTGGAVIATGGGTVLKQENVNNLLHNGRIYFIDRPLSELTPTRSRPLSADRTAMEQRYHERLPLYRSAADVILSGSHTPSELLEMILEDFQK